MAQKRTSRSTGERPNLSYDLGASLGNYAGKSYTELNLGLNWYLSDNFNWRNSVFSRFGGSSSVAGLDSSMRLESRSQSTDGNFGSHLFLGPGVRIADTANTGLFIEGGASFRIGGFSLGGGLKSIYYSSPASGNSNSDTEFFIILGGGGVL
jgi:hypothetical protein